ncbi:MAG: beta-lactamase family protein [Candidatus Eremiobacteraeota bacterium]|nr:beta-lactamase family protein [Candidatus Eremiobacteraeota bacterium]
MFYRLCLILALGLTAASARIAVPDTPAGHALNAWLQAFDRGDRIAYRQFLHNSLPSRVKDLDQEMQFRAMTGGFDLRKVEVSTPRKIVALVQERLSDQFGRLTLQVENAKPHRIAALDVSAIPRPADFSLPHLGQNALITALRSKLDRESAADRFSGAVLMAHGGTTIFARAYGLADREHKVPNTLDTRFRIGSMNKMFTAVAILQLVQTGKLGLDDPLGKYLTDYPNKDVASNVSIRELLTHTGGTGDIFGPQFEAHRLQLRTLDDYVKLYGSRGPKFKPGSRWEYSNYGFVLLGVVIEKATGQSYYDYVREHVYVPAGMASTDSEPEDQPVARRSIGYTQANSDQWQPNTDTLPYRGTSAGGGFSTVNDLLGFALALQNHKLLDSRYTEMLTTGKVDTPHGRYAFGFEDQTINGTRCFGHGGGAPGMNGDLEICPGPNYVVAVLANLDPPAASRISDFITNRLPTSETKTQ